MMNGFSGSLTMQLSSFSIANVRIKAPAPSLRGRGAFLYQPCGRGDRLWFHKPLNDGSNPSMAATLYQPLSRHQKNQEIL